jgi:hypothetical protein
MAQNREYQGLFTQRSGCTYSSLGNVCSGGGSNSFQVPLANQGYVVPKFCPDGAEPNYPPRYDTLSHGQKYQCGGYFNVSGAYPYATCSSCNSSFVNRPCNGNIQCGNNIVEGYVGCGSCSGGQ